MAKATSLSRARGAKEVRVTRVLRVAKVESVARAARIVKVARVKTREGGAHVEGGKGGECATVERVSGVAKVWQRW